ncbi:MAG: insulinase family protein [Planctomycetes bacterium]|nr:insulinase family protein [Planctomycetota bacterium]
MRFAVALSLFLAALPAAVSADETREKTLQNGLKILVHPMTGAPLVTVMTMYHVGSANEPAGQTGITHLCEHMLFKGSKRFPDGEANREAAKSGGYVNGYTNTDEITFFHVVPKERLLDFLDRHADAMENATFDAAEFRKEMVVVRSELEGDENNPQWLLARSMFATAFQAHGLHHPVIGWRADVERITPGQVKTWYQTHFRPNNAVVIVVGDVDADAAVAEIETRFAGIAPGQIPFEPVAEPPQEGERRVTVRAPSAAPMVEMSWHNAPTGHPDSFALEVMQEALGRGQRARLYRALVDTGLASDLWVGNAWSKYPNLFTIHVTVIPGKDPAAIEKVLDGEIERIRTEGISADETARCIRQIARTRAFSLDATEKVAGALADFEAYSSWRYGLTFSDEVAKVTPERLKAAANKYLLRDNRTVGILLPEAKSASPDLSKSMGEIDRAPKIAGKAAAPATETASTVEFTLSNGVRVLFWKNPSSPTVALQARWPGGRANAGDGPALSSVALEMLHEGTVAHEKAAFDELLEARGFTMSHYLGTEFAEASTAGLSEDFETAATLLAEFLQQPRWPEAAFAVAKERVIGRLGSEPDSPEETGHRAIGHALFAPGHPRYAGALDDVLAAAATLTLAQVRTFHESHCRPKSLVLAISGSLDEAAVRRVAEKAFGGWKLDGAAPPLVFPAPRDTPSEKRIVVFLPEKSEAFGAVALPCPMRRDDPEFAAFDVLNHILGGGEVWTTRLGKTIRVENGLAYDTQSGVTSTRGNGYFYAQFGSNPENVDKALALLREEIRKIHDNGVSEEEVNDGISFKVGAFPRQTETSEQKAAQLLDLAWYGMGIDYVSRRAKEYRAVTREKVNAAARRYLDPDKLIEVIAGTYGKK